MSNWQAGDVKVNGIKIHYHRTGGAKPPLVLAHGITDNGLCWTRLAQALEADYDLIMLDARGHGLSDVPAEGYSSTDHAADLAGLIQELGLQTPALLGHSMGAATVATLAATYPALTNRILLEDPPWRLASEAASPAQRLQSAEEWRTRLMAQKAQTRAEIMAGGKRDRPMWADEEFDAWSTAKQQVSPKVLDYVGKGAPPWWEYVGKIVCPTLLLTGDVNLGGIVSPELAETIRTQNPQVQVAHIAGAGHNIRREQFEVYLHAVRGFLAKK